jgi:uncharacterized protein (DUF488 family)
MSARSPLVLTIGHSTRSLDELVALIGEFEARALVDVRRFPASRRYPHFNGPALALALRDHGIDIFPGPLNGGGG